MKKNLQIISFLFLLTLLFGPLLFLLSLPEIPKSSKPIEYIVQEYDTCSAIATLYWVNVAEIIKINELDENCTILVNQKLLIPPTK